MFKGSLVALITPLTPDDKVDYDSLQKLVEYHIAANTKGIVAVGTTGESATLDVNEHVAAIKKTVEFAKGRIPVIAGTGANATHEVIAMNKHLEHIQVDACLSVTPYYNKPPQEGLYQHFKAIAQQTDIPQILYNVPSRTAVDLLPETVARLAEVKGIIGIKDATGDLTRVQRTVALCGKDFMQLSGDDFSSLEFIKLGGHGTISVTANVAAKQMATLFDYALQGEFEKAEIINELLNPLHKDLFVEANPIPVKWLAHQLGLIKHGFIRLPLVKLNERFHQQVLDAASNIKS